MTTPQRISALIAVGRILTIFATLRKSDFDYGNSGSAVRKYAAAFARPDAARGGKNLPDTQTLSGLIAAQTMTAQTSSTPKPVPRETEFVHRGAWKAGVMGALN